MSWRFGLRASIALTVVLVTVLATATTALVSYRLQAGAIRARFIRSAQADFGSDAQQAHQFLSRLSSGDSKVDQVAQYLNGRLALNWYIINLRDSDGPVSQRVGSGYLSVAESNGVGSTSFPASLVDPARQQLAPITITSSVRGSLSLVIVGQVEPDLLVVEAYSNAELDGELAMLRFQLAAIAAVVAAVGAGLGVLAARGIQRRVAAAAAAARRFGEGAMDTRLPVLGHDELAELASSFNAMAQQLRRKDEQQRRFVADVAHDLRTPLASMVAATDGLHSPDSEDRDRSAELLGTQVRRLSTLVDDLLEMSRFDAGVIDLRPETVDLAALVEDAIGLEPNISLRTNGNTLLSADPRRLHTVVRNLLTNAVHHGAPPVTVTVDGRDPDWLRVAVADSGPGLPEELAPLVFDRFVRGDRARGHTEGSGLGLAIAHENAVLHGGRIEVANDGGAVFTLVVPRGIPDAHETL